MNDLPPPPCSAPLRAQPCWCPGLKSLLPSTLSYAMGEPGARRWGAQEDTNAGLGCFSLGWHRVLSEVPWTIICRAAQEGSGTQGKQRRLTSPRSLALGLAFSCLPSACCRNPRLFGLRGKERHLEVTLGEQIHALSTCDLAVALCISLKRLGCASSSSRAGGQGVPPCRVWPCWLPQPGKSAAHAPSLSLWRVGRSRS